jgi:hypothetical protein
MCNCKSSGYSEKDHDDPNLITIHQSRLEPLHRAAATRLAATKTFKTTRTPPTRIDAVHLTDDGDVLVSSAVVQELSCAVAVIGTVDSIVPVDLGAEIEFIADKHEIHVRLAVDKPMEPGEGRLVFDMHGVVLDENGEIVGADDVTLRPTEFVAAGIGWWCVLKCGGLAILKTLIQCLPTGLKGGPKAYMACVVAKVGKTFAGAAVCIGRKCTS